MTTKVKAPRKKEGATEGTMEVVATTATCMVEGTVAAMAKGEATTSL